MNISVTTSSSTSYLKECCSDEFNHILSFLSLDERIDLASTSSHFLQERVLPLREIQFAAHHFLTELRSSTVIYPLIFEKLSIIYNDLILALSTANPILLVKMNPFSLKCRIANALCQLTLDELHSLEISLFEIDFPKGFHDVFLLAKRIPKIFVTPLKKLREMPVRSPSDICYLKFLLETFPICTPPIDSNKPKHWGKALRIATLDLVKIYDAFPHEIKVVLLYKIAKKVNDLRPQILLQSHFPAIFKAFPGTSLLIYGGFTFKQVRSFQQNSNTIKLSEPLCAQWITHIIKNRLMTISTFLELPLKAKELFAQYPHAFFFLLRAGLALDDICCLDEQTLKLSIEIATYMHVRKTSFSYSREKIASMETTINRIRKRALEDEKDIFALLDIETFSSITDPLEKLFRTSPFTPEKRKEKR